MTDELDPRAVLAQVQERADMTRLGLIQWREMDRDVLVLRRAAEVLTRLLPTPEVVGAITNGLDFAEHEEYGSEADYAGIPAARRWLKAHGDPQ